MKKMVWFCLLLVTLLSGQVWAGVVGSSNSPPTSPSKIIEDTTDQILVLVTEAKGYFEQDPDRYYRQIETALEPVVDFEGFSRAVMGYYGSDQYYSSLPAGAQKEVFAEQVQRFSAVFKKGLVQAYGKGFLAFSGERIEVIDPEVNLNDQRSVNIRQLIHGNSDKPFEVIYKMRQDETGNWLLRNVTIQAINLGKVYRNQFAAAAQKYHGNIDEVIDNWLMVENEQVSKRN